MAQGNRLPIPLPIAGLSDDDAYANQAPGTSRELVNARGLCPLTGSRRVSQRAGSSKLLPDMVSASKIDLVEQLTYSIPRVDYEQLVADFASEWDTKVPPGSATYSPRVDRQGNVFCVAPNGTVYKYNSTGTLVDTIVPPIPQGVAAVPVIRLDETDALYIAGSVKTGTHQGYVWKYVVTEDREGEDVYDLVWTLTAEHGIVDFDVRGGLVAMISSGLSDLDDPAILTTYASAFSSRPIFLWQKHVPAPANAVRINSSGDVLVTCQPNEARGLIDGAVGAWQASAILWSPHEEYESETRLHSWFDVRQIVNQAHGENLLTWEDRRFIATDLDNLEDPANNLRFGQPGATDSTDANVHTNEPTDYLASRFSNGSRFVWAGSLSLAGPSYRLGDIGNLPSLYFDASRQRSLATGDPPHNPGDTKGCRLAFRSGASPFKNSAVGDPTSDGTNGDYNNALVSHHPYQMGTNPNIGYGNGYAYLLCGVAASDDLPGVIFSTTKTFGVGRLEIVLAQNVRMNANSEWVYDAGRLTLTVTTYSSAGDVIDDYSSSLNRSDWDTTGRGFFIATLTHGGTDSPNGFYERDRETTFRINGIHVRRYVDMGSSQLTGQSTNMGARHTLGGAGLVGSVTANSAVMPAMLDRVVQGIGNAMEMGRYSFEGHLFEQIVLLHPDSAGGHANFSSTVEEFDADWGHVQPSVGGDVPFAPQTPTGTMDPDDYTAVEAEKQAYTKAATTVERFEGYLAHANGAPDALADPAVPVLAGGYWDAHPFGGDRIPFGFHDGYNGYGEASEAKLSQPEAVLAKYSITTGALIWAENGDGIGYGLALDIDDHPICAGPASSYPGTILRKVRDDSGTVSLTGDDTWTYEVDTSDDAPKTRLVRLETDKEGDVYWPLYTGNAGNVGEGHLRKLANADGELLYELFLGDDVLPYGFAFPQVTPFYNDDEITGPEFGYISTSSGQEKGFSTLWKMRLVKQTQAVADGTTLRRIDLVTIAGGDLSVVRDGAIVVPPGGANAHLERSPYIQGVQSFGHFFSTDGERYRDYDPIQDEVVPYEPNDGGEMPARARILTAWIGRIIMTRSADEPFEIYASEQGNPWGWNRRPGAPSVTQAWSGRSAGVGSPPDVVNAFIPATDDIAYIGMDSQIWRVTGDPAAGGSLDVMTDQVGISFGNSWTKDPGGRVYAFTSRGGVIVIEGGGWARLSENRIERRLQDLDLSLYQVRLMWDYRREGLVVLPVPTGIGGTFHRGWFFEAKTGSWWEDDWAHVNVQPSAICTLDGDKPDDRKVILGCEDGYLRYIDELSADDDDQAIDWRVLVGPLAPPGMDTRFRFSRPRIVLASDQNGAEIEFYANQVADVRTGPWASSQILPGHTKFSIGRVRGNSVWVRMRNNRLGERCSIEGATIAAAPAGRCR